MESQDGTRNGTSGEEGQQQQCLVCRIEVLPSRITSDESQDKSLINDCAHLFFNKEDLEVFERDFSGAQGLVLLCGECKTRLTDVKGFSKGVILIEERVKEAFGNLMKEVSDLKLAAEWAEACLTRVSNPKGAEAMVKVKTEYGDMAGHFRKGIEKANKRISLLLDSLKSGKLVLDGFKFNYISNEVTPVPKVQEQDETDAAADPDDSGIALLGKEPVVVLARLPPETIRLAISSSGAARSVQTEGTTTVQKKKTSKKNSTPGTGPSSAPTRFSKGQTTQDGNSSSDEESSEDETEASSIASHASSSSGLAAAASVSKRKISQRHSYRQRRSVYFYKRWGMFHCKRCDKSSKHGTTIRIHYITVHLKKRYKCDICNVQSFTTSSFLNLHKKTCRQNLERIMAKEKDPEFKFVCEVCGKRFNKNTKLNSHRSGVHRSVDRYPCDLCDKKFKAARNLQNHKNVVHFRKYFCRFCKKVFRSRSMNITHERTCKKNKTK